MLSNKDMGEKSQRLRRQAKPEHVRGGSRPEFPMQDERSSGCTLSPTNWRGTCTNCKIKENYSGNGRTLLGETDRRKYNRNVNGRSS